jgi:hypothetical protein
LFASHPLPPLKFVPSARSGGEAIVKLKIAEALQGKRFMLLPVSEGGMNLKTTGINKLIETAGVKALSEGSDESR